MKLIKKIILWIIKIFKMLFGNKKVTKKIKSNITNAKNNHYLKGYGAFVENSYNETFPIYLMLSQEEKKKLLDKMEIIKKSLDNLDEEEKKKELDIIHKIVKKIEKSDISFYQESILNEKIDNYIEEKERQVKPVETRNELYKNVFEIIDNFDDVIQIKVAKNYKYVNYVTITTLLIDETKEELKKLEENYKNHKYNKSYYDREFKKISERIKNLKKIRDGKDIQHEIYKLRKDLYTKSKDKYDLLYNEEIFSSIEKECNDMLKKVDRKVIDLKRKKTDVDKEKQPDNSEDINEENKKKKRKEKEEQETLENILKRYRDIELARKLLLLNETEDVKLININDLVNYLNKAYTDFCNGEKVVFNFEKNKTRTELIKLYNSMNKINCKLKGEEYISIDHINYQLDDLIIGTENKKKELELFLEQKYDYKKEKHEESILVNNKLEILKEKEMGKEGNKEHVFVKVYKDND